MMQITPAQMNDLLCLYGKIMNDRKSYKFDERGKHFCVVGC